MTVLPGGAGSFAGAVFRKAKALPEAGLLFRISGKPPPKERLVQNDDRNVENRRDPKPHNVRDQHIEGGTADGGNITHQDHKVYNQRDHNHERRSGRICQEKMGDHRRSG